ncbi:MAG: hypothetical protein LBL87_07945 [Ruminococcus sp.]|nr:hypothetical protein [Ruminococcus sp.]
MKLKRLLPAIFAVMILFTAGCTANKPAETTSTMPPMGTLRDREGDDAYAIDKLSVEPLPEGAWYIGKMLNGFQIMSGEWSCTASARNYKDQFQSLETFAESAMASLVITYKYQTSDLIWEDPVETKVAGYDAILYNFTIKETLWQTEPDGSISKDADGKDIPIPGGNFTGRGYFFYSGTDVYYLIFDCRTENYEKCAPDWDQIIANVKVDEGLKLPDVTTISAQYTNTEQLY